MEYHEIGFLEVYKFRYETLDFLSKLLRKNEAMKNLLWLCTNLIPGFLSSLSFFTLQLRMPAPHFYRTDINMYAIELP